MVATTALAAGVQGAGSRAPAPAAGSRLGTLQILYANPVLVRAGERVEVPVDVVCATPAEEPCEATVALRLTGEGVARLLPPGVPGDLTAVARQVLGGAESASVPFALEARDSVGRVATMPEEGATRFYVLREMRTIDVPSVAFGDVRPGRPVLTLPWGTGPHRVGLEPGDEAPTLGPPAFDVDAEGRVHLLDPLQERLAVFDHGRLVRETSLPVLPRSDVAVADDGRAHVLTGVPGGGDLLAMTVDAEGRPAGERVVGTEPLSTIRAVGAGAFVRVLPLDAWVPATAPSHANATVGRPLADGRELLMVAREHSIRLGVVEAGAVTGAVELRFAERVGDVPLAEADGEGGYWVVARTWREDPTPADQYQVVHVRADGGVATFAVGSDEHSQVTPLARFRLRDGALYQLATFPSGVRVIRHELRGLS